jgi:hypothetical protein
MMNKVLHNQLNLLKFKYEALGFMDSIVYNETCALLENDKKIASMEEVLSKIENGEKIFNVVGRLSKKLSLNKVDEFVLSAFAEYDTGRWLTTGFVEGNYESINYIPSSDKLRSPDYSVKLAGKVKPIETKIIFPENLNEYRCVRKILDKINSDAIPQLKSFSNSQKFNQAIVFIWTHSPIPFEKITYQELETIFKTEVNARDFELLILVTKYNSGLWDFQV